MTSPEKTIGLTKTLNSTMEDAEQQVTEALKAEGFGILTEIDVSATFKKKLDVDFRPYKILGACNPGLAHRALSLTGEVGLLLPCNVTLSLEADNLVNVSMIDPRAMFTVLDQPELEPVVEEAREKLQRVLESL